MRSAACWLTFALVGAGPTGVELAWQIREVATETLRSGYRRIRPDDARVMLFDGGAPRWPGRGHRPDYPWRLGFQPGRGALARSR